MKPSVAWSSIEQNGFKRTEIGLLSTGIKDCSTMPGPSCLLLSKTRKREKERECVCMVTYEPCAQVKAGRGCQVFYHSVPYCAPFLTLGARLSVGTSARVSDICSHPCGC